MPSDKTIGRLSLYRRLLHELQEKRTRHIYSYQLAALAGVSAAQTRRDIMEVGYSGSPQHGYDVEILAQAIARMLDASSETEPVVLAGLGNLGRAIVSFFRQRHPRLTIVATFDSDPQKAGRVIHGTRCHPMEKLAEVAHEHGARVGIIAVPAPAAQEVAWQMIGAGIRGILNFAPVPLKVPAGVHCENFDMTLCLEKVAYHARQK